MNLLQGGWAATKDAVFILEARNVLLLPTDTISINIKSEKRTALTCHLFGFATPYI